MKKAICLMLSLIILLSLLACSEGRVELHPSPSPTVEQTSAVIQEPAEENVREIIKSWKNGEYVFSDGSYDHPVDETLVEPYPYQVEKELYERALEHKGDSAVFHVEICAAIKDNYFRKEFHELYGYNEEDFADPNAVEPELLFKWYRDYEDFFASPQHDKLVEEYTEREFQRLEEKGVELTEQPTRHFTQRSAYLTAEQILDFPASNEYYYILMWYVEEK